MSNILDGNINDQPFPDFIPTGKKIVIKALGASCAYHSITAGGIHLPSGKDESAFFKAEIIEMGPDVSEWVEKCRYIHVYAAGGLRGAKPISLANGHFICDEEDIWFWEETTWEEATEENSSEPEQEPSNLIKLVTE